MGENSKIEWCDHTFNPWIGCTRVSPACDHCYAAVSPAARSTAARLGVESLWGKVPRYRTSEGNWNQPLVWDRKARKEGRRIRVFCASLADVFDNAVPGEWRRDLFRLIGLTSNIDWLLLTKRIGNAESMMNSAIGDLSYGLNNWSERPWKNVWLGATVINQEEAERDIPKLLATPACMRFVSMEPLLGPVNLRLLKAPVPEGYDALSLDALTGYWCGTDMGRNFAEVMNRSHGPLPAILPGLDWVIVGGESGHGARPMHARWARAIRDDCAMTFTPFLFKQWGEWLPGCQIEAGGFNGDGCTIHEWNDVAHQFSIHLPKSKAGRTLDGRTWDGFPESLCQP